MPKIHRTLMKYCKAPGKLTLTWLICFIIPSYPMWIMNGNTASLAPFLTSALRSSSAMNRYWVQAWISSLLMLFGGAEKVIQILD